MLNQCQVECYSVALRIEQEFREAYGTFVSVWRNPKPFGMPAKVSHFPPVATQAIYAGRRLTGWAPANRASSVSVRNEVGNKVIDQPRVTHPGGDRDECARANRRQRLERIGIDDSEIVQAHLRFGHEYL